jgi:hypothetical protein
MPPLQANESVYVHKQDWKLMERTLISQNVHEIVVGFGARQHNISVGLF